MIRVRDAGVLKQKLLALPEAVRGEVLRDSLLLGAFPIAAAITAAAPVGETGNLQRSIRVTQPRAGEDATSALVTVGPDARIAPHAHLVEYGHAMVTRRGRTIGHVPAHPFMRPGFEASKDEAAMRILEELRARVEAAAGSV